MARTMPYVLCGSSGRTTPESHPWFPSYLHDANRLVGRRAITLLGRNPQKCKPAPIHDQFWGARVTNKRCKVAAPIAAATSATTQLVVERSSVEMLDEGP